jgi:inner membrane protein
MDPIAHTFTGAALAGAGLRRVTPLATATLILAANAPDVDIVVQFAGMYASLAHRRGWTHGVLALAIWPFVLTAIMLAWDRWRRRRRDPQAAPVRPLPILGLAALGVATHPALDWLNTYGMRWLMPFDGRWFYGDAVFIVDPWIWLALGGVLFLQHSSSWSALIGWGLFFALATTLMLSVDIVPAAARALWIAGLLGLGLLRLRRRGERLPAPGAVAARERRTRITVTAVAAYIVLMVGLGRAAEAEVRRAMAAGGESAADVMAGPAPADPFGRVVVAAVPSGYYRLGEFHWLRSPRLQLSPEPLEAGPRDRVVAAAAQHPDARDFLTWVRFPVTRVEPREAGYEVVFSDARAAVGQGPFARVVVWVDAAPRLAGP